MRPIYIIATDIRTDWKKPYFGAVPYIGAMLALDKITDNYGADPGDMVVRYLRSNASTWRGPVARRVKVELKAMLK